MVFKNLLQGTVAALVIGSFTSVSASSIRDWEGSFDEGIIEEGTPRGFGDERNQPFEDTDVSDTSEVVEVAVASKRQNFAVMPRKDLPLVPLRSKKANDIVDETQTTGENAKKKLPSYVTQNQPSQSSLLHDIHQVTTSLLSMDLQRTTD